MSTNENGLTSREGQPVKALTEPSSASSSRSTATDAQIGRLLERPVIRPHHTHELRRVGISHPAGRISDLEKRGYSFDVARITTVDGDGYPHRGVAFYTLTGAPETAGAR